MDQLQPSTNSDKLSETINFQNTTICGMCYDNKQGDSFLMVALSWGVPGEPAHAGTVACRSASARVLLKAFTTQLRGAGETVQVHYWTSAAVYFSSGFYRPLGGDRPA